jgi:hypothetical protein
MPSVNQVVDAINKMSPAARAAAGGAGGAVIGHEVTPRLLGFRDDPAATNMSTFLDTLTYGTLGAMGPAGIAKAMQKSPMAPAALAAGVAGGQTIPVAMKGLRQGTEAAGAATRAFDRPPAPTISEQAGSFLQSPTARGAGMGASGAALAAILTGLLRAKNEQETERGTGRVGMVTSDFLKYLVPALLAGGVVGSLKDQKQPSGGLQLR